MKGLKFCVSLMAAVSVTASAVAVTCLADETSTVEVDATSGDQDVTVGNVNVASGDGVDIYACDGHTATVLVDGSITGSDYGICAEAYDKDSTINLTVNGDVESEDDEAVALYTDDGANINVEINGDITCTDEDALYMDNLYGSNISITVNGDINGDYDGIEAYSEYDSTADITVNGDVTGGDDWGIYLYSKYGSTLNALINGDITSGDTESAAELLAYDDSSVQVDVDGSITSISSSPAIYSMADDGDSELNVTVTGDLSASHNAIYAYIYSSTDYIDILVEGTVSGGEVGVTVSSEGAYSSDNFTLTAWQIEVNSDGIVADTRDYNSDPYDPANEATDFEEKINYIVKYEQPASGGTISAKLADGSALAQNHGFDTANETQKIVLSPNLSSGYEITAAYNGTTALDKDEDGNYYLVVPRGGGILLSVDLKAPVKGSPKTGEDGTLYLVGAIVLLAGGSVALLKTRKKEAEA